MKNNIVIITSEVEAQDATFKQNALENLDPEGNRGKPRDIRSRGGFVWPVVDFICQHYSTLNGVTLTVIVVKDAAGQSVPIIKLF